MLENFKSIAALLAATMIASVIVLSCWWWFFDLSPFVGDNWRILPAYMWTGYEGMKAPSAFFYPLAAFALPVVSICLWPLKLPEKSPEYGSAMWAKFGELQSFNPPVLSKTGIALGKMRDGFGFVFLRSNNPLATTAVAPAGTGKTQAVILPSIYGVDEKSIVVNDPKGELYADTAGYRASVARKANARDEVRTGTDQTQENDGANVFVLDWMNPDKSHRWNPIGIENMPEGENELEQYVDRICQILIPEKPGDANAYFTDGGRGLLVGIILYLHRRSLLKGESLTPATMVDFLSTFAAEYAGYDDPTKSAFRAHYDWALDANTQATEAGGLAPFSRRCIQELGKIVGMAERPLSSIKSTAEQGLRPFNTTSVQQITSTTNIDTRLFDQEVCSLYVIAPALEETYNPITAMLIDKIVTDRTVGPPNKSATPLAFIIDEAAYLPPAQGMVKGPSITRGYGITWLFALQSLSQLNRTWGPDRRRELQSNTAYTIILTQNDPESANAISQAIGDTTVETTATTRERTDWFGERTKKKQSRRLIQPNDIMSLEFGTQIVVVQSKGNRPIKCASPFAFEDPTFKKNKELEPPERPRPSPPVDPLKFPVRKPRVPKDESAHEIKRPAANELTEDEPEF